MTSINPLPLVDATLMLLIIFLVAFGVLSTSVPVNVPIKSAEIQGIGGNYVVVRVDKMGNLYLTDRFAPDIQALSSLMQGIASRNPQPELHIRADPDTQYAHVGQVIETAQGHGFSRVHLITGYIQK